jgi:tRNA A-37 threonylcarbamoyl transferase component Bud32/thioredoxin-like negative regulator of GroEL
MAFASGENVGAYRIVDQLGQGGMATVYKAYHAALDRYVAIKVMHAAFLEDPNFLARFQREARIVAKLDHPHIIPIYDYAEHNGQPYLVMRFVEGETLKAHLAGKPRDMAEILRIAKAIGDGLAYAHSQGVLHRDIKPSNILLTPEGGIYLTDFGLARMAEAGESTLSRDMMMGTPQYISPEQAKGVKELDARTDIYSLGVVLYELLVGQVPFMADTPYAIVHDHIFSPLPMPRELNPDLPESIERVLLKALAKEPDDRFQSVEALIAALENALQPSTLNGAVDTIAVPPPSTVSGPQEMVTVPAVVKAQPKKRGWLWIAAAVAACLCIGAFLCFFVIVPWLRQREARQTPVAQLADQTPATQLMEQAQAAEDAGDWEGALELYQAAIEADPQMVDAYIETSAILLRMQDQEAAMKVLDMGIQANPDSAELHATTAGVSLLLDKLGVAEKEVRWMTLEMSDLPTTHAFSGILTLLQGGTCAEATPALEKALRAAPEHVWARYGAALCSTQEGNAEAALADLEFVISDEKTPALLRVHAEELYDRLSDKPPPDDGGEPSDDAILEEFDALLRLASDIEDGNLRQQFETSVAEARKAWKEGDKEHAIELVEETDAWVQENEDALGDALARVLTFRLKRIVRLAG